MPTDEQRKAIEEVLADRQEAIAAALIEEAETLVPLAHRSRVVGTAYLAPPDDSFPSGHPRRSLWPTSLAVVAYDQFPSGVLQASTCPFSASEPSFTTL